MGDNDIINGLWVGSDLTEMEMVTIASFLANGHRFRLWIYHALSKAPIGVEVCDGNAILPASKIWRYPNGSLAGFADLFRMKLLHELGGWWVDMDVTCLKHFDFEQPYVFRPHGCLTANNIIKAPKGCPLMLKCYEELCVTLNENNKDWDLPSRTLGRNAKEMGLLQYVVPFDVFGTDADWPAYFQAKLLPKYAIHWCRTAQLAHNLDPTKNACMKYLIEAYLGRSN